MMQKTNLRGKTITIVGPATFETFLKAHYLTQMTGVSFRFFHEEPSGHPTEENGIGSSMIVLVDCEKGNVESCLSAMKADSQLTGIFQKPMLLFNVAPEDVKKQEEVNEVSGACFLSVCLRTSFLKRLSVPFAGSRHPLRDAEP